MKKTALVTGATSGFGRETARLLAEKGFNTIITGRRLDLLEQLAKEIENNYQSRVLILCFDVRSQAQVDAAIDSLTPDWKAVDVLINNAGLAVGLAPIHEGTIDDWERMLDTNIKGLLYVTRKVAPLMVERGSGHIVNVGSIAGTQTYENGNVYCASKHAVHALSQGMRADLIKHNIKVSEIRPGLAETEFSLVRFKGDEQTAKKPYIGLDPLTATDVAEAILFIVTRPQHVNINDLEITPTAQASSYYVFRKP